METRNRKRSATQFLGGHARAAALRLKEGYENIALQELIACLDGKLWGFILFYQYNHEV